MNTILNKYQDHLKGIIKNGTPIGKSAKHSINNYTKGKKVVKKKNTENKDNKKETYVKLINGKINLFKNNVSLSSEAFCYFYTLEGHPKNLFFYILNNFLNKNTLHFKWNSLNKENYSDFCVLMGTKRPSIGTVNNAFKQLPLNNIACIVKREEYMLNPVIIYKESRVSLWLREYSNLILDKGKLPEEYLFPKI